MYRHELINKLEQELRDMKLEKAFYKLNGVFISANLIRAMTRESQKVPVYRSLIEQFSSIKICSAESLLFWRKNIHKKHIEYIYPQEE